MSTTVVEVTSITSKKGNQGFKVKLGDGTEALTFDNAVGAAAMLARQSGSFVEYESETTPSQNPRFGPTIWLNKLAETTPPSRNGGEAANPTLDRDLKIAGLAIWKAVAHQALELSPEPTVESVHRTHVMLTEMGLAYYLTGARAGEVGQFTPNDSDDDIPF